MTSDPFGKHSTSRRRFVLDVFGGLAGTALVGCGASSELKTTRTGGSGGEGAAPSETGGAAVDAGDASPGTGGLGGGGNGGADTGGAGNGGSAGVATGGGAGTSTGGASGSGAGGAAGSATGGAAGSDAGTCALYPQQTEGPFYLDLDLLRSDITEGKPGMPLELELTIISANGCAPIANAVVDIWQCDADGVYAGFPGQLGGLDTTGQKFLRGTQITGADGKVIFHTIYPGWYPGRTTHIHFKVHLTATTEVTSQMYFPEDVTAAVYYAPPYETHGQKDTSNLADSIAQTGGFPPVVATTAMGGSYKGRLVVSVMG